MPLRSTAPVKGSGAVQASETSKPTADPVRSVGAGTSGGAEGVAQAWFDAAVSVPPST